MQSPWVDPEPGALTRRLFPLSQRAPHMKNLLTVSQAVSRPPVNTEMVPQTRPHFSTWELAPEGARRSPSFSEPRPQQGAEGLRAHPPPPFLLCLRLQGLLPWRTGAAGRWECKGRAAHPGRGTVSRGTDSLLQLPGWAPSSLAWTPG